MATKGTHERVFALLTRLVPAAAGTRVLDIGAGAGALSARLAAAGYRVAACELHPESFVAAGIECRAADESGALPFADASFDVALAVELVEHVEGHRMLFDEARRVLRPGGLFIFTTPNILSLKSRLSFLLTGYVYSFPPLDPNRLDPVSQHITPFSLDRYRWRMQQSGLELAAVEVDRYQSSSLALTFLLPLIRLVTWRAARSCANVRAQNALPALLGRKLVVVGRRPS